MIQRTFKLKVQYVIGIKPHIRCDHFNFPANTKFTYLTQCRFVCVTFNLLIFQISLKY